MTLWAAGRFVQYPVGRPVIAPGYQDVVVGPDGAAPSGGVMPRGGDPACGLADCIACWTLAREMPRAFASAAEGSPVGRPPAAGRVDSIAERSLATETPRASASDFSCVAGGVPGPA